MRPFARPEKHAVPRRLWNRQPAGFRSNPVEARLGDLRSIPRLEQTGRITGAQTRAPPTGVSRTNSSMRTGDRDIVPLLRSQYAHQQCRVAADADPFRDIWR